MVLEVDWFQVGELNAQCVEQLRDGLAVGNAVERLVQAYYLGLQGLEATAMGFIVDN